ncbi:MAG: uroporphyrinogen-III synthase [bacterium]|nr:uroporphyrinogen-III synthase [bacterium]
MKRRVLIARDRQRAAALLSELQARGIEGICVPVTRSEPLENLPELPDLADFSWIAFTSVHGVTAFSEWLQRTKRSCPVCTRLAAVGHGTAEAVRARLREPHLIPRQATGNSLAEEIIRKSGGGHSQAVLWPCARKRTRDFEETLTQAGFVVTAWECYETVAVESALLFAQLQSAAPWDAVLLAAPSAARSFADTWPPPWDFSAIAIGETTAAALRSLGVATPTVCSEASDRGMLEAIAAALPSPNTR